MWSWNRRSVDEAPHLSGSDLRKALERIGFVLQRQKGSHMILRRENPHSRVVVPDHRRLRVGTLRQILHEAGLSVEQLKELVKNVQSPLSL